MVAPRPQRFRPTLRSSDAATPRAATSSPFSSTRRAVLRRFEHGALVLGDPGLACRRWPVHAAACRSNHVRAASVSEREHATDLQR